ncbi:MAG: hypothetical protein QG606_513 [Patescibacteria group bacterium]|jgi:hypothetical protein|nr:hypothetical protein [Patescibacteria group bacterium]
MFTIRCSLARILCTEVWLSLDLSRAGGRLRGKSYIENLEDKEAWPSG